MLIQFSELFFFSTLLSTQDSRLQGLTSMCPQLKGFVLGSVSKYLLVLGWIFGGFFCPSLQTKAGKQKKYISLGVCRWTARGIDYGVGKSGWLIGYHLPQPSNVLLQDSRVSFDTKNANWENHQGRELFMYATKEQFRYFVKFQKRGFLVCNIAKVTIAI